MCNNYIYIFKTIVAWRYLDITVRVSYVLKQIDHKVWLLIKDNRKRNKIESLMFEKTFHLLFININDQLSSCYFIVFNFWSRFMFYMYDNNCTKRKLTARTLMIYDYYYVCRRNEKNESTNN